MTHLPVLKEPSMNHVQRRRVFTLVVAACLLAAVSAGVALGTVRQDRGRGLAQADPPPRVTIADDLGFRDVAGPLSASWVDDHDIITVRGTKCPKSHPRKVGSSSSESSTQINGGKVTRHTRRTVTCAR
jgi:hypothetical protein